MSKYRKALVALAGVAVIVGGTFGLTVPADAPGAVVTLFDAVAGLLTALGVREVANDSE